MKFLKKTIGLFLALALGLCSLFALSACDTSDNSGNSADENKPLTEEQKIALKSELYTAMSEGQTKDYKGLNLSANISVNQSNQKTDISLAGALAVTGETELNADIYVTMNVEGVNEVGGAFWRGETIYLSDDTAESKDALVTAVTGGTMTLMGMTLSDLMEKAGMGGMGDVVIPEEPDVTDPDYAPSTSEIVTGIMQSVLPVVEANGGALIDKYIGAIGAADKADGGYVLKITFAELADAIMENLTKAATVLDSARDKKVSEICDVAEVKELTDVLFKGVTAEELDEIVRSACLNFGLELPAIEVTATMTVTDYLKALCNAIVPADLTVGDIIDGITSRMIGSPITATALVTTLNTYVTVFKQMITAEVTFKFDTNKQIVSYSFSLVMDTATLSPMNAVKVTVDLEMNLLETAPALIDLTNANIVTEKEYPEEDNPDNSVELPVVPLAA